MREEIDRNYAALIVEVCDDSEWRLLTEGTASYFRGYTRGISPAFKAWWRDLKRAKSIHRSTKQTTNFREWWHKELGTFGGKTRKPLTRALLAERKTCPKDWTISLS